MEKIHVNTECCFTIVFTWDAPDPNHDTFNEHPHWATFKVYESIYESVENEANIEFDESDQLCHGYIKWDGCMEIHDLNAHFCGWSRKLEFIMRDIFLQAAEIMDPQSLTEFGELEGLKAHYNLK